MKHVIVSSVALSLVLATGVAVAQLEGLFIYPGNNQTKEQQAKDESECSNWAKEQTGYDPLRASSGTAASAPPPRGGAVGGAAKGAALGAVGGAIAGDAGKGAAVGAAVGGLGGGMRQRSQRRQQEQQQQAAAAGQQQQQDSFRRAFSTCMEARQYTVK